jgi:hypothetical protein
LNVHHDTAENSPSVRTVRPRLIRIVHRATDRCCLEYEIGHLTPAELGKWVKSVEHWWDSVVYKFEFPDRFEEGDR